MGTAVSEPAGHWVEPDVNYVDPERRFCAYCGRPIARRYWAVEDGQRGEAAYCSPEHAERKATYPIGQDLPTPRTNRAGEPGA